MSERMVLISFGGGKSYYPAKNQPAIFCGRGTAVQISGSEKSDLFDALERDKMDAQRVP